MNMKIRTMLKPVAFGLMFSAFLTNVNAQYCTPTSEEACSDGDEINTFILNGENGTSIVNNNTGCAPNGYDNRTGESVDLAPGMSYTANISSSYSYIDPDFPEDSDGDYCAIWIDFNDDQIFSLNEMVAAHNDYLSESGSNVTIAIPSGALSGEHRMRVMVAYPYFEESFEPESAADFDPCNQGTNVWEYGEVHDYTVNITGTVTAGIDSVVAAVENNGSPVINTAGGTLQMVATVYPATQSQNVIWSIVAVDGNATISANGLVTATADGSVWAKAVANEDITIADSVLITIANQSVAVESIQVITQGSVPGIISTLNGTLQMVAIVSPAAANQNVTWSIVPADGNATISASGLVTAASDGNVWAKATAVINTAIADSLLITISGQSTHIDEMIKSIGYQLFPNPVKGTLNIQIQREHPALNLMIVDAFGKKITELTFNKNALQSAKTIDVNHLPAGLYFIHVTGAGLNFSDKFIKQ